MFRIAAISGSSAFISVHLLFPMLNPLCSLRSYTGGSLSIVHFCWGSSMPQGLLVLFFYPFARAALLTLFDTFGQQILNLAVDGSEIILRPSGQILPQLRRNAQKELLLPLFLLFQSRSPPLVNSVSAFQCFGKPFRPALYT